MVRLQLFCCGVFEYEQNLHILVYNIFIYEYSSRTVQQLDIQSEQLVTSRELYHKVRRLTFCLCQHALIFQLCISHISTAPTAMWTVEFGHLSSVVIDLQFLLLYSKHGKNIYLDMNLLSDTL